MNRKYLIIGGVTVAIIVALVLYFTSARHFDWVHESEPQPEGHQPYDMALFDELMERSLPKGYTTRTIESIDGDYQHSYISEIKRQPFYSHHQLARANTDTALMVVHRYSWEIGTTTVSDVVIYGSEDNVLWYTYELSPELNLLYFASRGGTALLVTSMTDCTRLGHLFRVLGIDDIMDGQHTYGYGLNNLAWRDPDKVTVHIPGQDDVALNTRFADVPIKVNMKALKRLKRQGNPNVDVSMTTDQGEAYLIDLYYPRSGGHLYITTLMPYFSNLGLRIKDGDQVIAALMDKISDKPVVRVDYPANVRADASNSTSEKPGVLLSKIASSDALSWAWWLSIILVLLLLLNGIMRKYPAVRGAEIDELDKTDAVAIREYQFRKSPLLHFLFQCSWLYNGNKNYVGLFNADYHRFARVVSRSTGIEFKGATPEQLKDIAKHFAPRQGRTLEEVLTELEWMHTFISYEPEYVTAKQFSYAHTVIEKYPLS